MNVSPIDIQTSLNPMNAELSCLSEIKNPSLEFTQQPLDTKQNAATIHKTHQIGLSVIIGAIIVGLIVIGACAATGVGIVAVVAAVIPLSAILALKTGAIIGTAVGLILTPVALYLIKNFVFKRDIPNEDIQNLEKAISTELQNPSLNGKIAPPFGEYSLNDGFITADSSETLELKLKLIESAEQSIEIMPNYFSGKVMAKTLDIIEEQLNNKPLLKVHIISSSLRIHTEEEWNRFEKLKETFKGRFKIIFISPTPTHSPELNSCDNHMKMVIVDEKYFVLGGSSLIDEFSEKGEEKPVRPPPIDFEQSILAAGFRDHDLVGKGSLAKTMRLAFFKQYATWEYTVDRTKQKLKNRYFPLNLHQKIANISSVDSNERLVKDAKMKLIVSTPHCDTSENLCTKEYKRIISKAKELKTGSLYFDPVSEILGGLAQAIANDASIKILTNGVDGDDPPPQNFFTVFKGKEHYRILNNQALFRKLPSDKLAATVLNSDRENNQNSKLDIYEYNVPDTSYHAKLLSATDAEGLKEGIIGTYNLSLRSHHYEDEAIVVFENSDLVDQINNSIENDCRFSRKAIIEENPSLRDKIGSAFNNIMLNFC